MTAPPPDTAPRTMRGRVLALGVPQQAGLDRFLMEPSIDAESIFHAMAAISVASADEPIGAVLVGPNVEHDGDDGLRALRRVDPALPVVLFDTNSLSADATIHRDAFDDVLLPPLTSAGLSRAFERNVAIRDEPLPSDPPTPRPVEGRQNDDALTQSLHTSPAIADEIATPSADDFPVPKQESRAQTLHQSAQSVSPPAQQQRPATRLGDVDLVACIARGDGTLSHLAIDLIRQQTGWDDLTIARDQPTDDCFAIERDGENLGWLHGPSASPDQLRAWAQWLAHWLGLERDHRRYRRMAFVDDLTGAWNRRYFMQHMREVIAQAREKRIPVSIMVFDVDNFKSYNDSYGHEAGDEILIETVRLLHSVIRQTDKVCRIGGDEFVVVFADLTGPREDGSRHPARVEAIARRFQEQICKMRFPKLGAEAPGTLTISAGLANFPWDGSNPEELLRIADQRALASKRAGKNAITFGPRGIE